MQIILIGKASGKKKKISIANPLSYNSILDLFKSIDIPIASSCNGVGQCKKCITSDGRLSCQIKLSDLRNEEEIEFDYL